MKRNDTCNIRPLVDETILPVYYIEDCQILSCTAANTWMSLIPKAMEQIATSSFYQLKVILTNKQHNIEDLQCKKRDSRGKASKFQESFLPRPRNTG